MLRKAYTHLGRVVAQKHNVQLEFVVKNGTGA